jgi:hypothetical protein
VLGSNREDPASVGRAAIAAVGDQAVRAPAGPLEIKPLAPGVGMDGWASEDDPYLMTNEELAAAEALLRFITLRTLTHQAAQTRAGSCASSN